MGVSDPTLSRLKLIVFLAVFLSFMYTAEAVILTDNQTVTQTEYIEQQEQLGLDVTEEGSQEQAQDLTGLFVGGVQFITFTIPQIPLWMQLILTPISMVMLIIVVYLAIDIVYDWIKALPFT